MELEPDFVMDVPRFEAIFRRFAAVSDRSIEDLMRDQGRLFMVDVIRVTPPFHQGVGQNATVAKKAGEKSIVSNSNRLFAPVPSLVGSRRVPHLFGKKDVPGLPYVVPAPEKHPDVEGIYERAKSEAKGRARQGVRFPKQKKLPVSRVKVRRIYLRTVKSVGWLAGGWNAAATALGAASKVPAFVRRHGSAPGAVAVKFTRERLSISMENRVSYADSRRIGGLDRRIYFALRKREDAMEKQIPRLIRQAERELMG